MPEPWDFKTDDTRPADSRATFIIFCEDGEVEPAYFLSFRTEKLQISPIRNCGKHHQQVDFATEYFRKNDLIEFIEGNEMLKLNDGAQAWCVFDRDKEENDMKDTAFNDSISMAESKGIRTAWSNDDFELWVLLHFEEVDLTDPLYNNRNKYYERLTSILGTIEPKSEEEKRVTRHKMFNYYSGMKSKRRFVGITLPHMKDNTETAIERSKALELFHSNPPKANHEKCPCTLIHHLVIELINSGK